MAAAKKDDLEKKPPPKREMRLELNDAKDVTIGFVDHKAVNPPAVFMAGSKFYRHVMGLSYIEVEGGKCAADAVEKVGADRQPLK